MESSCAQDDLTWSSWHIWCAQKTQVILGRGAIWPSSLGPLTRSTDSQDQLVVAMLFKNLQTVSITVTITAATRTFIQDRASYHKDVHSRPSFVPQGRSFKTELRTTRKCIQDRVSYHKEVHSRPSFVPQGSAFKTEGYMLTCKYIMLWVAGGICTLKSVTASAATASPA